MKYRNEPTIACHYVVQCALHQTIRNEGQHVRSFSSSEVMLIFLLAVSAGGFLIFTVGSVYWRISPRQDLSIIAPAISE